MKLLTLEISFFMRQKRTRVLLFLNYSFLIMVLFYSYSYFADLNPSFTSRILMIGWLFLGLNFFTIFPIKTFSFTSNYLVALFSRPQILNNFFKKRFIIYVYYSSFFFVQILTASYWLCPEIILYLIAAYLYSIGFNLPFSLLISLWNSESIELNRFGGDFNFSLYDALSIIPVIHLLLFPNFEFQILILLSIIGGVGILSFPFWNTYLLQLLYRKKYQIIQIAL